VTAAAIDGSGNIWMVGYTTRSDFPVTRTAIQSTLQAFANGFISEYSPASNQVLYSSFFGGGGSGEITQGLPLADGTVVFDGTGGSTPGVLTSGLHKRRMVSRDDRFNQLRDFVDALSAGA
jgi:hypothetical protein